MLRQAVARARATGPQADSYVIAALTVAALFYGQALFIPLALAMLLAFAMTPGIAWLKRRGLPKTAAASFMLVVFLGLIAGAVGILATQTASLIEDLPKYERTLRDKIASIRGLGTASGSMDRAGETLKKLQDEIGDGDAASPVPPSPLDAGELKLSPQAGKQSSGANSEPSPSTPVPVEVRVPPMTPLQQLVAALKVVASPLASAGIVLLFLIFILIERESLRDRLIRVLGKDDVERSTTALNETAGRLSRYLAALFFLNLSFGVVVGLGLWAIGVPGAALWGLLAGLMRFVPFIGSIIAGVFPVLLAAAVDPGWTMVGLTLALFLITEPLMGHVIEPIVQGRATGLSMLAILIATAFWTLLWGPVGLLLAVPLTLVLVSFGKHLEPLAVFSFLLGDEPPLSPAEKFYQRILSGDAEDAVAQAEEHLEKMDLGEYYDAVVRGALNQAARDYERQRFDEAKLAAIKESVVEVADLLSERDDSEIGEGDDELPRPDVVCIGARTPIDDAGAHVLAHLLNESGISARVVNPGDWRGASQFSPRVVCVGAFSARHRIAYASRIAAKACRGAAIVSCHWAETEGEANESRRTGSSTEDVVSTFASAVQAVQTLLGPKIDKNTVAEPEKSAA